MMLPGAGDDLQGIKKGVLEIADMIAVNKADGDNVARAERAAADYRNALHILSPQSANWTPPVLTFSGLHDAGVEALWSKVMLFEERMTASGEWQERREQQRIGWMWSMFDDRLKSLLRDRPALEALSIKLEQDVKAGTLQPGTAVDQLFDTMFSQK